MWMFISVMSVRISGLPHGKALLYFRNLFSCFLISALIHFLTSIHIFSFPGFLFNPLSCTTAYRSILLLLYSPAAAVNLTLDTNPLMNEEDSLERIFTQTDPET